MCTESRRNTLREPSQITFAFFGIWPRTYPSLQQLAFRVPPLLPSQQNANQCKLGVRGSCWKCLRLQKILILLICNARFKWDKLLNVKSQMPTAPEYAFKEKSTKYCLPPLRTIYFQTFQCETTCTTSRWPRNWICRIFLKISPFCHFGPPFFEDGGGGVPKMLT